LLATVYLENGRLVLFEFTACPEKVSGVSRKHTVTSRPELECTLLQINEYKGQKVPNVEKFNTPVAHPKVGAAGLQPSKHRKEK
jgi:hypothetical protein